MTEGHGHCTQRGTAPRRAIIQNTPVRAISLESTEIIYVTQRVGGVKKTHQRLRIGLAELLSATKPVQRPGEVALGGTLLAQQVHTAEGGHRELISTTSGIHHCRGGLEQTGRAVQLQ